MKNRRFLGNKYKLLGFIEDIVDKKCNGFSSICDIFAGTGVVGERFNEKDIKVISNDILKSNFLSLRTFLNSSKINLDNLKNKIDLLNNAMRGGQSINQLRKLGLVAFRAKKIFITGLGELFLGENYDLGEIFFRSFIKWQIPNPDSDDYKIENGHNIKPFIGTLHLINLVNKKSIENNDKDKAKGLGKQEFSLFVPTLTNFSDIEKYANEIIKLRKKLEGKSKKEQRKILEKYKKYFIANVLKIEDKTEAEKFLNNIKDYGDNAIKYFRLTRYLHIRGGGYYVDLEPRRQVEISNLLSFNNSEAIDFKSKDEYLDYIANIEKSKLPWENIKILSSILENLIVDIVDIHNYL